MADELVVITKTYDLIVWMIGRIGKFPRSHRFVLGERMENTLYDVLDRLLEAKYTRRRRPVLDRVSILLERLRFQWRMSHDFEFVSTRQYHFGAESIQEIGRLVGGWRKAT